jgi:broad specificity phosphatase PhoE
MNQNYIIPPSILNGLQWASFKNEPVALFLRHSVRDPIPHGETGHKLPITEVGQRISYELGAIMGDSLQSLYTSPVLRCVQTAEMLREGSERPVEIHLDRTLGDPGALIVNSKVAWDVFCEFGYDYVFQALMQGKQLNGFADPQSATQHLIQYMMKKSNTPGIHVFVTHDILIMTVWAMCQGSPLEQKNWPWFLEGIFFSQHEARYRFQDIQWKGKDDAR